MPLTATISSYREASDSRATGRHTLRLEVSASSTGQAPATADSDRALIYNLSTGGLLLETTVALDAGDMLVVSLPEVGPIAAEVIWARDGFAGCRFERPIPAMAVSAARLRSEPAARPQLAGAGSASQPSWSDEFQPEPADGPLVRAVTVGSLTVALLVAAIFVVALLSFPFSTN